MGHMRASRWTALINMIICIFYLVFTVTDVNRSLIASYNGNLDSVVAWLCNQAIKKLSINVWAKAGARIFVLIFRIKNCVFKHASTPAHAPTHRRILMPHTFLHRNNNSLSLILLLLIMYFANMDH